MRHILAIDPGDRQSAVVLMDGKQNVLEHLLCENADVMEAIYNLVAIHKPEVAIEMIASYGMPVGKNVFETCVFIGRLVELCHQLEIAPRVVYRKDVKMHLCQSMKAKDGNIRQALIDLYPPAGGGKNPVIGTKAQPGPLYGMAKDKWAALGVAHTAMAKWNDLEAFSAWTGMKVLDTHLGSGSIAIAAHYAGVHLTACELDEDYYKAACARIEEQTSQQALAGTLEANLQQVEIF